MGNLCSCLSEEVDTASEVLVDESTPLLEDEIYRIDGLKIDLRLAELDAIIHSTGGQMINVNLFSQDQPPPISDMVYSPNGGDMVSDSIDSVQSANVTNDTFSSEVQQNLQESDMPSLSNYTTTATVTVNDLDTVKFQFVDTDSIDDESKELKETFGDAYDKCIRMDFDDVGDLKLNF